MTWLMVIVVERVGERPAAAAAAGPALVEGGWENAPGVMGGGRSAVQGVVRAAGRCAAGLAAAAGVAGVVGNGGVIGTMRPAAKGGAVFVAAGIVAVFCGVGAAVVAVLSAVWRAYIVF